MRTLHHSTNPIIRIHRESAEANKLVYIAVANRMFRYSRWGKSRIVYIGMTKVGVNRVASSAAHKAAEILKEFNCKHLDFYTIHASGHQGVALWEKLERALIIRFREIMGDVPRFNRLYKYAQWRDEQRYVSQANLDAIIKALGSGIEKRERRKQSRRRSKPARRSRRRRTQKRSPRPRRKK